MIAKRNVIYQKDRRIRLPELIEENLNLIGGTTNLDIIVEENQIILRKSKQNKPNNYKKIKKENTDA